MRVVEAIIFDCFGVFVGSNFKAFCTRYVGGDSGKLEAITNLDKQACLGQITHEQFIEEVSRICLITSEEADHIISNNAPDFSLLEYVRDDLHPRYRTGLLSNASSDWLDQLFTTEQLGLFNDKLLSFEVGLVKPDTEIFALAATRLGVTPDKCIFIDDSITNCDGAVAAGMQAIHYESFEKFKSELSGLLS